LASTLQWAGLDDKLKKILDEEKVAFKLSEEQFKDFLMFLSQICRSYLKVVEKIETKEVVADLDAEILKVLKENKLTAKFGNSIPVNFFLQYGFNDILDVEPSYYKVRDEVLKHSKWLKEDPKNVDYLIWEPQVENEGV
jgi:hypothetical protein